MSISADGMKSIVITQGIQKAYMTFKGLERERGVLSPLADAQKAESNLFNLQ